MFETGPRLQLDKFDSNGGKLDLLLMFILCMIEFGRVSLFGIIRAVFN